MPGAEKPWCPLNVERLKVAVARNAKPPSTKIKGRQYMSTPKTAQHKLFVKSPCNRVQIYTSESVVQELCCFR